jgi:hypothetical protein
MSQITDNVFAEVCLDERIADGIFKMEEEQHMNALRDYFIKRGITKEAAIHVTNRMTEGKYPDRQAYRAEDGILVTWPSAQHMAKAFKENPGKYVKENPKPSVPPEEPAKEPIKRELPKKDEEPIKDKDDNDEDDEDDESLPKSSGGNIFGGGGSDKESGLEIEPPHGEEKVKSPPIPTSPTIASAPRTPERIAAEKEVAMQIINTDDHALTKIEPPISEICHQQLNELYKRADALGYKEAVTFLTRYVKS